MKIILKESQYLKLRNIINEDDDIIEVKENPTKYTYIVARPFEKGTTSKYYFNDVLPVEDENPIPGKITLVGNQGIFIFDKNDLKFNDIKKTIGIDKDKFHKLYQSIPSSKQSVNVGINSSNIKKALEKAFPSNWNEGDFIFSAGLRGIYTIGDKTGDKSEDWSIMNYFDTKPEIHDLLYLKYTQDKPTIDIVDWMADVFSNDVAFTQTLVDRQWQSIKSGVSLERESADSFLNKKSGSVTFYPYGSKMDRFYGIDVTIDDVNYQIKPLNGYTEKDGVYTIFTYGMRDYKSKKLLNKIVFANKNKSLVFDNNKYDVISRNKVSFNQTPEIYK